MLLFFDTETTGLPVWKEPSESEGQPHIVQLAAALVCPLERDVIQYFDVIVKPDNWEISEEMTAIHGISQEFATLHGVPEQTAVEMFMALQNSVRLPTRVAHNKVFDERIIRIALKRYFQEELADIFHDQNKTSICTMRMGKPILGLKDKAGKPKNPSLSECYKYFFDREIEGAHNAMVDVRATIDIYFAMRDLQNEGQDI